MLWPNKGAANHRLAEQVDGSYNLIATVAADPALRDGGR